MLKKRLFSLLLVIVMAVSVVTFASAADPGTGYYGDDGRNWNITELAKSYLNGWYYDVLTGKAVALRPYCDWVPERPAEIIVGAYVVDHVVAPWQTLAAIAARHGTTVAAIKADNKVYFDRLDASNRANRTVVEVEEGVVLTVKCPGVKITADLIHTIQAGETLASISQNWYGTPNNVAVIKAANKVYFDWLAAINKMNGTTVEIEVGETLILPGKGLIDPIARHALTGREGKPIDLDIPRYNEGFYLVKKGETLQSISDKFYGTPAGYTMLAEANKGKLGPGNSLFTGQWLVIIT